uniref:Putative carbohydrate esterase family 4 protein n=1 Tax=Moniliophthora roreri TaxID=221103 RepID=A0A0W0G5I6_MONRR
MKFVTATVLLALGAFTVAAPHEKRQMAEVITSCTQPNTVALTFDDGPWNYIRDISDTLTNNGAKGTFFFNGNNWGCIYDQNHADGIRYVYGKGHQVASHTWRHANLAELTWDQVHDEMWRVEQALERIVGAVPAFMRPPYGSYNDNVRWASAVRGQAIVNWDFDSGDSAGQSVAQQLSNYNNRISQRPNSILALNHETYASTAYDVLPQVVQRLRQAGYRMVTVAECLGRQPYQRVVQPGTPDGNWRC